MTQSLKQFQSVFKVEPVRFELDDFAKDGAFSAEVVDALREAGIDAIFLKPLTSEQRANFEASIVGDGKKRDMHNLYARYVSLCWVDEEGHSIGPAGEVGKLRSDLVSALFEKVQELNGASAEAAEELGKDS